MARRGVCADWMDTYKREIHSFDGGFRGRGGRGGGVLTKRDGRGYIMMLDCSDKFPAFSFAARKLRRGG